MGQTLTLQTLATITCSRLVQVTKLRHYLKNHTDIIMEEKNRREATRVQVPLVGTVTLDAEGEGLRTIEVAAKDVSLAGAYLWADAPIARIGDKIRINLSCASELEQFQLSVKAVGTVVRVDQPQEGGYGFAVKFKRMPDFRPG